MSVAHTMAQMYKLDGWQNLRWKREINKNIPDAETPFFLFFSDKTSDEIPPSPPTLPLNLRTNQATTVFRSLLTPCFRHLTHILKRSWQKF